MSGVPQRIGKYEILGEIGRGGMGIVYKALDPSLKRHVAVKVLTPQAAMDPIIRKRFVSEAIAAAAMHHPNVVTVFEAGDAEGTSFFSMELIEAPDLATKLKKDGTPPIDVAIPILQGIADALDYAHSKGIVHRDVKATNVLMRDGIPKLADFGIARQQSAENLTVTGVLVGTPAYMAPELWDGHEATKLSDQYAFGIIAYELLTGQRPFDGDNPMSVGLKHLRTALPKPQFSESAKKALGSNAASAIDRILSKNPQARFPNCRAFVEEIRPKHVKAAGGAKWPMIAVAVLVLVGIGFGVMQFLNPPAAPVVTPEVKFVEPKVDPTIEWDKKARTAFTELESPEATTAIQTAGIEQSKFAKEFQAIDDACAKLANLNSDPKGPALALFFSGCKNGYLSYHFGMTENPNRFLSELQKMNAAFDKMEIARLNPDDVKRAKNWCGLIVSQARTAESRFPKSSEIDAAIAESARIESRLVSK